MILVDPAPDVIFNRNVFALSIHGELLWQIEESPHGTQVDKPYVNLYCDKNGTVIAGNWNGVSYSVNLLNGTSGLLPLTNKARLTELYFIYVGSHRQ